MTTKHRFAVVCSLLFCSMNAQTEDYKFSREIAAPSSAWHRIELPDDGLRHYKTDFSDIRIIGKNEKGGSVEVPYVLEIPTNEISKIVIPFQTSNTSRQSDAYFYTFELTDKKKINQILLEFAQQNFDWTVGLEGSNNQSDWFTILDNYRILSIKNKQTDYQFTQLDFPNSDYIYYRLKVNANEQPKLTKALVFELQQKNKNSRISSITDIRKSIDKKNKTSVITLTLQDAVPVTSLRIKVANTFDYYRPLTVSALKDSTLTDKGWHLNYIEIFNGTLSSLSQTPFQLDNSVTQKLKITINNHDNQPLEIEKVEVQHSVYLLLARFTEKAAYFLYYGNEKAETPSYDLANFTRNIPEGTAVLAISRETINPDFKSETTTPLFENKLWLWILMGIVILFLGYFSLKMLKE